VSYRRPVQVLVYLARSTDDGWRWLLLHRIPERGGFWQGVTGGAEWGEGLPDAARREMFEETGFRPIELLRIDCMYTFPMEDEWKRDYLPGTLTIEENVFLAVVDGKEPAISAEEHDDWRWCAYEEALGLLAWAENIEALRCCWQVLENR